MPAESALPVGDVQRRRQTMKEQRNRSQLKRKLRAAQAQQGRSLSWGPNQTSQQHGADSSQPLCSTCRGEISKHFVKKIKLSHGPHSLLGWVRRQRWKGSAGLSQTHAATLQAALQHTAQGCCLLTFHLGLQ